MGMTRDEAIQKLSDLGFVTPEMIVDGLAVLGVLKLDKPAKKTPIESLAEVTGHHADNLQKALEQRGIQIVDKNDAKEAAIRRICEWCNFPNRSLVDLTARAMALRDACK